jgi:hypothetical protein
LTKHNIATAGGIFERVHNEPRPVKLIERGRRIEKKPRKSKAAASAAPIAPVDDKPSGTAVDEHVPPGQPTNTELGVAASSLIFVASALDGSEQ